MSATEEQRTQALREEADKTVDDSLESTRRMKKMALETQQIGDATLVNINEQGEQITRIEQGLENVNNNIGDAEKELEDLEKCCGCCVCPWNRQSNFESSKSFGKTGPPKMKDVKNKQPGAIQQPGENTKMKRIVDDAREDEMEENLNAVDDVVGNLLAQAQEMNTQLSKQNAQLDQIEDKMDSNNDGLTAVNIRAQRQL